MDELIRWQKATAKEGNEKGGRPKNEPLAYSFYKGGKPSTQGNAQITLVERLLLQPLILGHYIISLDVLLSILGTLIAASRFRGLMVALLFIRFKILSYIPRSSEMLTDFPVVIIMH